MSVVAGGVRVYINVVFVCCWCWYVVCAYWCSVVMCMLLFLFFCFYTLQFYIITPRSFCHTAAVLAGFVAPYERGGVFDFGDAEVVELLADSTSLSLRVRILRL